MGILSFLKRSTSVKPAPGKKVKKSEFKRETKKVSGGKPVSKIKKELDMESLTARVLVAPIISEKATSLAESNKYVFKVSKEANKKQIAKAISRVYKVNVLKVNIIKKRPKKRRLGRSEGFAKGFKKAIVTLKKGDKIEIFKGV